MIPNFTRTLWMALALGLINYPARLRAGSPLSVDKVIREMELTREKIQDLTTVVERFSVERDGGEKKECEIHFSYKRPDKLKSESRGGNNRTVVINGREMWIYSPELQIVEKYLLEDEEQQQRALFEMSWGLTSPIKALVRGMNRSVAVLEDGPLLVKLIPDQKDAEVARIQVWVDPKTWLITRMDIFPINQPLVRLKVKIWQANSGLADDIFQYQAPEGADIFEPPRKAWGHFL